MSKPVDRTNQCYVRHNPGAVCAECGADISFRAKSTLYCIDCTKKRNAQRILEKKRKFNDLLARDAEAPAVHSKTVFSSVNGRTYKYYECPSCHSTLNSTDHYCRRCGKHVCLHNMEEAK